MSRFFETQNYTYSLAESGECALELMSNHSYDLVIMDMHLEDFHGAELFPHIRDKQPRIPVLITSGYTEERDLASILQDENTKYLSKPFRLTDIKHHITNLLS